MTKSQLKTKPIQETTFLISGATDGIGKVTALEIAKLGAKVTLIGRNPDKTKQVTDEIRMLSNNEAVDYFIADLSIQENIYNLAEAYKSRHSVCDVLINNAGALFTSRKESHDGIEMTFALNHLNYFLLTHLMLPLMPQDTHSRIINVSSMAHMSGRINFDDIQQRRFYNGWAAYAQSKLANVLLAGKLEQTSISTNALHPGIVATKFAANNGFMGSLLRNAMNLFSISPEEGSKTSIYLATSEEVVGINGKYFDNMKALRSSSESYDKAIAKRLWELSLEMTGLKEPYVQKAA